MLGDSTMAHLKNSRDDTNIRVVLFDKEPHTVLAVRNRMRENSQIARANQSEVGCAEIMSHPQRCDSSGFDPFERAFSGN